MSSRFQWFQVKSAAIIGTLLLFLVIPKLSVCDASFENAEIHLDNGTEGEVGWNVPSENFATDTDNGTIGSAIEGELEGNNTLLQSNDPRKVVFYLYSNPNNLTDYEELPIGDKDSLSRSIYNRNNPPIFLMHGFLNNHTTRFSQKMKDGFLQNGYSSRYNIFIVDWGMLSTPANQSAWLISHIHDLSHDLFYQAAVSNVPKVGKRISEFITFLIEEKYLTSPSDVHLIGFSLGAQVSGFAGYYTKQNNLTIGRITGLDPAGPLYQTEYSSDNKLDSTDALFVDVVHSNQGQDGYFGTMGHADFYPNGGGPNQPDCLEIAVSVIGGTVSGACAHNKAWMYYIKSMSENIISCKCYSSADVICKSFCTNKAVFGQNCSPSTRGSYYFDISVKGNDYNEQ